MSTAAADTAVSLRGLTKNFTGPGRPPVHAVRGVDLDIATGEVVALLGPNGAGKTTTLDMVLGLTEPTAGVVEVLGLPPRRAVHAGQVSAVLQTGGLLRDLTVRETIEMIASTYEKPQPVADVLERAGITDLARRKVSKCSGGEQQRLRFALALLPDPSVLVLDEPTAGMDVQARHDFWQAMHGEAAHGRTIIFATHYLQEADAFAERIVMMADGQVVADGSTEQIRSRASGRSVSADLPPDALETGVARLRGLDGVVSVTLTHQRVTVIAADSDSVARLVLTELGGHDLEVTSGSLDDAFMVLTGADHDVPARPTDATTEEASR